MLNWWRRSTARLFLVGLLALTGCAGSTRKTTCERPFVFGEDTLAYRNDLVWVYYRDAASGEFKHRNRESRPDYTHHCFVVARSVRQFFQHARFDPSLPPADEATYRKLIRQVVTTSPRRELPPEKRIVLPGYTNLFQFSQAHAAELKAESGGAWQSYFQRGHWRMVLPFSRSHQAAQVTQWLDSIRRQRPPVVHLVRFPQLTINHSVLLFDARETETEVRFSTYDPYFSSHPVELVYHRIERRFYFDGNDYFVGGWVNGYEVYSSWNY
jgi:hypothetical protein